MEPRVITDLVIRVTFPTGDMWAVQVTIMGYISTNMWETRSSLWIFLVQLSKLMVGLTPETQRMGEMVEAEGGREEDVNFVCELRKNIEGTRY